MKALGKLPAIQIKISARGWLLILLGTLAVIGYLYSCCLETQVLGFIQDDGMYTVTAKALAEGQGYRLLNVITTPFQTKYPILYPLFLSLGWQLNPHFPENISLLGLITVFFSLGAFGIAFYYFKQCKGLPSWLSYLLVLLTASSFFMLYYGTSVMSEGPYLFFSLLTLYQAERFLLENPTRRAIGISILLSALTFHTRTVGITLIAALSLILLFKKQYRAALSYTVGTLLLTGLPWFLWGHWHGPDFNDPWQSVLLRGYSTYAQEFWVLFQEGQYGPAFINTIGTFIYRLLEALLPIIPHFFNLHPDEGLEHTVPVMQGYLLFLLLASYGLVGHFLMQLIRTVKSAFQTGVEKAFSVSGLYLVLYCLMVLLWNYESQMARFLIVILPWLWYYLLRPCIVPVQQKSRWAWVSVLVILGLTILALEPFPKSFHFIRKLRAQHWVDTGRYPMLWSEYQQAMAFIRAQLPTDASIACEWDKVIYLYTGHPTAQLVDLNLKKKQGKILPEAFPQILAMLRHYHVQYLLLEPQMQAHTVVAPEALVAKGLLLGDPEAFQWIYTSPYGMLKLYRILPVTPQAESPSHG